MNTDIKGKRPPEAFMTANTFEIGIGRVIVSRFKPDDTVEFGIFLVDTYCLGIKDAGFVKESLLIYQTEILAQMGGEDGLEKIEPACGRKLLEQAAAYAARLGFAPHRDYKKACRVFGGISAAACSSDFVFGLNGKPFFIPGPYDTPQRIDTIVSVLDSRCGPGNYDFDLVTPMDLD
ncbi:MAG: hypothetical protein JWR19_733 [Pedosphaera sp.]|nr:hypothetical protein [Pedosphaera sp.]